MFDSIMGFFSQVFIKFASSIPAMPYRISGLLDDLQPYVGYINYFFPFYRLVTIFETWSIFFVNTVAAIMVITWAKNLIGR